MKARILFSRRLTFKKRRRKKRENNFPYYNPNNQAFINNETKEAQGRNRVPLIKDLDQFELSRDSHRAKFRGRGAIKIPIKTTVLFPLLPPIRWNAIYLQVPTPPTPSPGLFSFARRPTFTDASVNSGGQEFQRGACKKFLNNPLTSRLLSNRVGKGRGMKEWKRGAGEEKAYESRSDGNPKFCIIAVEKENKREGWVREIN